MLLATDPARYENDIPFALAQSAHNGTSHVPERRAEQERASYAHTLATDYATLAKYADTDEKRATLDEMFAAYRVGYKRRTLVHLLRKSRCLSTMIAGPSGFNTRRNAKRSDMADNALGESIGYRDMMLDKIVKALRPELRPIMAGDDDATTRLAAKLAKLEFVQAYMRAVNVAIRKHKSAGPDAQVAAIRAIPASPDKPDGVAEATARKLLEPDFCGRIGFADYQLTNTSAEIRRIKKRLATVTVAKSTPDAAPVQGANARLEDSEADNRVRLFYPGKPDAATRARLKGAGFRWTPSLGCWQAYRNHGSLVTARREAGAAEAPVAHAEAV